MRSGTGARLSAGVCVMAVLLPWALPLSAQDGDGGYRLLELDGYKVKWGEPQLGKC